MTAKVIKTEEQHEETLGRIEELMDGKPGTAEGDELELLVTLVELYEENRYPIDLPDPIEAIKFRMEQAGFRQQDLVPFIGSRSKVSEVLNGKRPLSLKMIRALNQGLGISAEVLLSEPGGRIPEGDAIQWNKFPVITMARRGWFRDYEGKPKDAPEYGEELLSKFFAQLDGSAWQPTLFRQHVRTASTIDEYALMAWRARVMLFAEDMKLGPYNQKVITTSFVRQLVHLSYFDHGPQLAGEFLSKNGIAMVVLRHLPRTHLDGAAMVTSSGHPVVAVTLRYDRMDNFWFTLCHELGHISLHFNNGNELFFDDFDVRGDKLEKEADKYAEDAMIRPADWRQFSSIGNYEHRNIKRYAESLRINPAIVAGRVRRELNDYRHLSTLIGNGLVRKQFTNVAGAVI